ncbi:MAG: hypothetical protein GY771_03590, partial [bacterium]|nr:hypothetical protein [bacterium]
MFLPKDVTELPYQKELDILNNVAYAKNIFDKIGVKILKVQPFVELEDRAGHLDAIAELYGKRVILDVKWTGMSNEQYKRELRYGTMDSYLIQARHYQSIVSTDFYFLVFGKSNWCEIIYIPYDEQAVAEHVIVATVPEANELPVCNDRRPVPCEGVALRAVDE